MRTWLSELHTDEQIAFRGLKVRLDVTYPVAVFGKGVTHIQVGDSVFGVAD
ncbi:hypothetical protein [Terriglobus roseus]|uniref:hypothetical protein n=1 Tax=Terriglobus roseus TaxID=392734 RepID=UPI00147FCB0E|nr:hypothetical protein [Terriglobus roseus]